MSEFTATVPGLTVDDNMAASLTGQSAPLTFGGMTIGTVTVVHAHVHLDGTDLTFRVDQPNPATEAALVTLHHHDGPLAVSLGTVTHTVPASAGTTEPAAELLSVAYPADRPDDLEDA